MVVLICPSCGASMEVADDRQFAFCQYCGTKIANIRNTVETDHSTEVANLLIRALEFEARNDKERALEYCTRILDMDPYNETARNLENRLMPANQDNNVTIYYQSDLNARYKLRVTRDGKNWIVVDPGDRSSFTLPVGTHRIMFSGLKSYTISVRVSKPGQKVSITYIEGRKKADIIVK